MKDQNIDNLLTREIANITQKAANSFPVTAITGPRQSGKTTLLKYLFPERRYVNLEDPDTLLLISSDIQSFLAQNSPCIIDQEAVDTVRIPGQFILSGSQNFLLPEKISQTLAGRAAIFEGFIITEFIKHFFAKGEKAPIYFWRDHQGIELDLLIEKGGSTAP